MADPSVVEVLLASQRLGMIGGGPISEAIAHAEQFVTALGVVPPGGRILDLGSGGGLPGLVIAAAVTDATVVLLDRREKRTDHLRRAVTRLGWTHVAVWHADAADVVRSVAAGSVAPFSAVTARGFGPPETTLRTAAALLEPGGTILISEPPEGDRWRPEVLAELGLRSEVHGGIRCFAQAD